MWLTILMQSMHQLSADETWDQLYPTHTPRCLHIHHNPCPNISDHTYTNDNSNSFVTQCYLPSNFYSFRMSVVNIGFYLLHVIRICVL